jgi:hypothetical protein
MTDIGKWLRRPGAEEQARETERKLLQTGPVGAPTGEAGREYVLKTLGLDTQQIGADLIQESNALRARPDYCDNCGAAPCKCEPQPLECEDCTIDGECTGRCDPDEPLRFRRRAWL